MDQPHHCIPCLHSNTTQHPCTPTPLPPIHSPLPNGLACDETITTIRQLNNNKSPGVRNTLPEMLKEGAMDVHLALVAPWHLAHRSCPEALQARCPHTHRQGGRQLTVCETSNHRPTVHRSQSLRQRPRSPPVQMPRQPATGAALWFQARQKLRRRSVQPMTCLRIGVEQRTKLYMCMLDLTKASDSVDRGRAWQILLSTGAPPKLVALIKDLHTNHSVTIRAELDCQPIVTDNDFKQGYTLAPNLFNVVLDSVVRRLLPQLR